MNVLCVYFSRSLVFTFPSNLRRWFSIFITSVVMSLIHGAIFWNVRSSHQGSLPEQEDINDRLALHYVLGTVAIWPTLMLMISDVWKEKDSVARDIKDRLFGRFIHFVSKVLNSSSVSSLYGSSLVPCQIIRNIVTTCQYKIPSIDTGNWRESAVCYIRMT